MIARPLLAAGAALLASTFLTAPALAQTGQPSIFQHVDENGVDLVDGSFNFSLVEGSIGAGEGGMALVRHFGAGGENDDLSVRFRRTESGGTATFNLTFGNRRETFSGASGATSFGSGQGNGATLTKVSASEYRYTDSDGTVTTYAAPPGLTPAANSGFCIAGQEASCELVAVSTAHPNGHTVTYEWDTGENCTTTTGPDGEPVTECAQFWRLRGLSNNFGYRIRFSFQQEANPTSGLPPAAWHTRSGAALTNTAVPGSAPRTVSYSTPATGMTEITTHGGLVWKLTRDSALRLIGIRRPGSASDDIAVSYAAPTSLVVSSVTADGVSTNYNRSVNGTQATMVVTNALSQSSTTVSDLSIGRATSHTDATGRTTTFNYDSQARLTGVWLPEGNSITHLYDSRGNVTLTQYNSKAAALPAITVRASFPSTCANVVTCNRPLTTTDARGNVTDYVWDQTHGGLISVTLPAQPNGVRPQTVYGYTLSNGVHQLTSISACTTQSPGTCQSGANEVRTTIAYGTNRLPVGMSSGSGNGALVATTATAYSAHGDVISVDGPLPGTDDTTHFRYDAARRLVGTISPDPDGAGVLKRRAARIGYRSDGQVARIEGGTVPGVTDPDWAAFAALESMDVAYDSNSRPLARRLIAPSTGATHALSEISYDALGRVRCTALRMDPARFGIATDACTQSSQAAGVPDRISRSEYSARGEVLEVWTAVGTALEAREAASSYTANGRVEILTDGMGNRTTYEYDAHDRLWRTRFPVTTQSANQSAPTTGPTADYEQLTYDAAGNVTQRRLRNGWTIFFGYDALNRLTGMTPPTTEPSIAYAYDNLGRMTSASQTPPSGYGQPAISVAYTYDALGRVLTETGQLGTMTSAYDLAGRRTRLTWRDGFFVDYDYLVTGEMTAIRENGATSGVGVLATFGYDDPGRRTSLTRGNATVTSYSYDAVSRLDELTQNLAGTSNDLTLEFAYNPANQIVSNTRSSPAYSYEPANVSRTDTHNGLNQIVTTGGASVTHDAWGNVTSDGTNSFAYSPHNRLRTATVGGNSYSLFYDPVGRLSQTNFASTTWLGYDGMHLAFEDVGTGSIARRYVHGPGIDEPIVWYEGSGTSDRRFLHQDEHGSVIAATDASGAVLAVNTYDEYGIPAATNIGRFQYSGQQWLPQIGLYHYRARMYHPTLGRFMQTDPIGHNDGMNLYAYVGGDPINAIDPDGLKRGFTLSWKRWDGRVWGNRNRPSGGGANSVVCPSTSICVVGVLLWSGTVSDFYSVYGHSAVMAQYLPPDPRIPGPNEGRCREAQQFVNAMASHWSNVEFDTPIEQQALSAFMGGRTAPLRLSDSVLSEITQFTGRASLHVSRVSIPSSRPYDPPGSFRRHVFFGRAEGRSWMDGLLGQATVIFDRKGSAIGLEDHFDFNTQPEHDWMLQLGFARTRRLARTACGASSTAGFSISAGTGR